MKRIAQILFALLILAGCSTPRRPATVTPAPATPSPINPLAALMPPGITPRVLPEQPTPATLSAMSRAEPQTVTTPSLATITMLPGYVNIEWNPSPDSDVDAYAVYYGDSTRHYTNETLVGNCTNCTLSNLVVGAQYTFAVTALATVFGLESDYSDELVLPKLWQVAEISFGPDDTNAVLESSPDLFNWSLRADSRHTTNNTWRVKLYDELPAEFFRSATYEPATLP